MTSEKVLISRPDSTALKGFLILLIILGHIRGLSFVFQMYLYSFHVQCFFLLPFLYPAKSISKQNVFNLFLKLFWPFILLYTFQILIAVYVLHSSAFLTKEDLIPGINNILLGIWSFFTGGIKLIDLFSTTQFLWFLPCFLAMSLIRMWYESFKLNPYLQSAIFFLGGACFVIYSVFAYFNDFIPNGFLYISEAVSPFSIWQGLGYFSLGTLTVVLITRLEVKREIIYWTLVLILTLIYFQRPLFQPIFRTLRFFMPVIFFLALYSSRHRFARITLFHKFGNRSLAIYLIHPFLCIAMGLAIPANLINNVYVICLQFIVISMLSYFLACMVDRIPLIRKILFPRGEEIGRILKI